MPTFGSLFAGIGGLDLGLEWAGWECRWQVEWSDYCQHNLGHHWPDVPRLGDITRVDWSSIEPVDLIAGGFPCQPFSFAGAKQGTADDRWLWPEFARAVRVLRPRYVIVENVPGLLAGHGGMGSVVGDLDALGYVGEWESLPAAAFGAPHLRDRVWIVAHDDRRDWRAPWAGETQGGPAGYALDGGRPDPIHGTMADPEGGRRYVSSSPEPSEHSGERAWSAGGRGGIAALAHTTGGTRLGPASGKVGHAPFGGEGSRADWWSVEPDVGRVAHGVPARVDRLRALGNAVVPQIPEWIGRRILEAESREEAA